MKRMVGATALALLLGAIVFAPVARAAETEWHSEAPVAAGIGIPAPLGEVGDIAFWAPNRGVLITAGNGGMPPGVYAYDGTGWHLYSTVCGGNRGSIAWAGPDEFWTVSDYATHQAGNENPSLEAARTLCHFKAGEVVASYAEPIRTATTYSRMEAAACNGPADCWFAGEPVEAAAPNQGPFHLHWNGGGLTAVPSLTEAQPQIVDSPGAISDLAFFQGTLYETATEAPFLREVNLLRPEVFSAVPLPEGTTGPFTLAADGGQLWAISESEPVALRSIGGGFERIPLESPLRRTPWLSAVPMATEPNGAAVWVGGGREREAEAMVTRISASGAESAPIVLPRPEEELGLKGGANAIACPGAGQCWLATSKGWLFHLGGPLPQDTDPAMHVLITQRPADNSTPTFVPGGVPEDNSGEVEAGKSREEPPLESFPHPRKHRAIVFKVRRKVIGDSILQLSFVLRAKAHVRLLAKVHKKVVAKTPRLTLTKGPHRLRLTLDPEHWPTGLDFQVHPAGKSS